MGIDSLHSLKTGSFEPLAKASLRERLVGTRKAFRFRVLRAKILSGLEMWNSNDLCSFYCFRDINARFSRSVGDHVIIVGKTE